MKVLVCGGRDYEADTRFYNAMASNCKNATHIIHGGANGADLCAGSWAKSHGIHEVRVDALWDWYGKRAGYERNAAMLALKPDLVLAFPGGRGTAMMVKLAREAGVEVIEC